MRVDELSVKGALQPSGIPGVDWVINPYVGCSHSCLYCYAVFMRRVYQIQEPWGEFLRPKVNVPELLLHERRRLKPGQVVLLSSVTDPYVPQEKRYRLTRRCLEALLETPVQVRILTRSPLVLRDLDVLVALNARVGISVTTDREDVARAFELRNPSIRSRVKTLKALREAGLQTQAFIAPLLPYTGPEAVAELLAGIVTEVLLDRMNYANRRLRALYERFGASHLLTEEGAEEALEALTKAFEAQGVTVTNIVERNEALGIVRFSSYPSQLSLFQSTHL
ncbi:MAG: radical SAM protein [Candidatus Methylomirabilales bacterium]